MRGRGEGSVDKVRRRGAVCAEVERRRGRVGGGVRGPSPPHSSAGRGSSGLKDGGRGWPQADRSPFEALGGGWWWWQRSRPLRRLLRTFLPSAPPTSRSNFLPVSFGALLRPQKGGPSGGGRGSLGRRRCVAADGPCGSWTARAPRMGVGAQARTERESEGSDKRLTPRACVSRLWGRSDDFRSAWATTHDRLRLKHEMFLFFSVTTFSPQTRVSSSLDATLKRFRGLGTPVQKDRLLPPLSERIIEEFSLFLFPSLLPNRPYDRMSRLETSTPSTGSGDSSENRGPRRLLAFLRTLEERRLDRKGV